MSLTIYYTAERSSRRAYGKKTHTFKIYVANDFEVFVPILGSPHQTAPVTMISNQIGIVFLSCSPGIGLAIIINPDQNDFCEMHFQVFRILFPFRQTTGISIPRRIGNPINTRVGSPGIVIKSVE